MSRLHSDLRRMMTLLVQERAALKSLDFPQLDRLAGRKSAVLDRLEASGAPADAAAEVLCQGVRAHALRNGRLFAAVIAGVHDAAQLIEKAKKPHRDETYGRDLSRLDLTPPVGALERRA